MRLPLLTSLLAACCLTLSTPAQQVQVFGGDETRASTTQLLFGEGVMGGVSISYGQLLKPSTDEQPRWDQSLTALRARSRLP